MWLDEVVCWDEVEYIPRYTAIWRFVSKGLCPFLKSNGYIIKGDIKSFSSSIATLLYMNRGESCLNAKLFAADVEWEKDDKDHYYHVLSESKWDTLWSEWAVWSDLNNYRGRDRQIDIQEYCWIFLDLEKSPQTRTVDELLAHLEETPTNGREDMYLREAAESNEWGGYRT